VLPDSIVTAIHRDDPSGKAALQLALLESGKAGYRKVATLRSRYFQQDLYTLLDPALQGTLGEIGFTVYLRHWSRERIAQHKEEIRDARRRSARPPRTP
jgi:hypothetical protein